MYTIQPKKMLILNILEILRKYTDEDHRLSQKEIVDILRTEYTMIVDRKAIKRNIMNLIDFGYDIEYSESVRMVPNAKTGELEESYILSDFYLVRDFTAGELRLLIDSLLFSKHIPYSQIMIPFRNIQKCIETRRFASMALWLKCWQPMMKHTNALFVWVRILISKIKS